MRLKFFIALLSICYLLNSNCSEQISGQSVIGNCAITRSTSEIMLASQMQELLLTKFRKIRLKQTNQKKQNFASIETANFPKSSNNLNKLKMNLFSIAKQKIERNIHKSNINFLGGTLAQSLSFPPDSMGAVGPQQYLMVINGRIKSFNKNNGRPDNILNTSLSTFFNSVRAGSRTSDPRVRYDRFTNRWFVTAINVPSSHVNNRIMIAVSNTGIISQSTLWRFFFIRGNQTIFYDYPTLGVDKNALYIGCPIFNGDDESVNSRAFVVKKSSILGNGPIAYTQFINLINSSGVGTFVPQGVDNFDSNASVGYFIGADNSSFGRLVLRRITNPGSNNPTISQNILLNVLSTTNPILVPHKGNNRGRNGRLDSLEDRLMLAHIRSNKLWTIHNVGVNNRGISSQNVVVTRNGSRWYQIDVSGNVPRLIQAGTLFQRTSNNLSTAVNYWMPSLMTSGQGHMLIGCSQAGTNQFANSAFAGRLRNQQLGTISNPQRYTNSQTAYNPPADPGSAERGRRWGDYSNVSLDPCDNMSFWTIQEYCNARNSWGTRIAKILAPKPATPNDAIPFSIRRGQNSIKLVIKGRRINGSGFYDPGSNFNCRLRVQITGGIIVKSINYQSPTKIIVHISTANAQRGLQDIIVINPDGQRIRGNNLIKIV